MAPPPLEDNAGDVIAKAARGLGLGLDALAAQAGIEPAALAALLETGGPVADADLTALAAVLGLHAPGLLALAGNRYPQVRTESLEGLAVATAPFGSMTVNSCLVWDPINGRGVLIDTGAAGPLLQLASDQGLHIERILLTHTDHDHIPGLTALQEALGIPVHVPAAEQAALPAALPFKPDTRFRIGNLTIVANDTAGHTAGHTAYTVRGLGTAVAVVGDAIFAGSMGRTRDDLRAQIARTRAYLRSLPPGTLLVPGHGPLTTSTIEVDWNPFLGGSD